MALTNEEIAADLTWRYVEHLRERAATGNPERLSQEELTELRRTLEMAGELPGALTAQSISTEAQDRLRARLHASIASATTLSTPATEKPVRPGGWRFLWHSLLTGTAGAAVGLAAAVVSVGIWHPTPTPIRVVAERPANVAPMTEQTAHTLIPEMIGNRLPPGQERNLMWHMLVCPGCFEEYTQLREHQRVAVPHPAPAPEEHQIALR